MPSVIIPAALIWKWGPSTIIRNPKLVKSYGASILAAVAAYIWIDHIVRSWPVPRWEGFLFQDRELHITLDVLTIAMPVCFGAFNSVLATSLALYRKALWRGWISAFLFSLLPAVLIAVQLRQDGTSSSFLAEPFVSAPVLFGWLANPAIFGFLLWSHLRKIAAMAKIQPRK